MRAIVIAFLFATVSLSPLRAETPPSLPAPLLLPKPAQVRIDFDAKRINHIWVQGLAERSIHRAVTADDPVRIASISKLFVALGVMRLVEAGKLDLDRDVSTWLGWSLRNPKFPDTPITLRLLLSHRSSLTDDADYLIPLGTSVQNWLAKPKAWDATHAPGTWFRYTNLNFPVVASVMEAATGERFDRLMTKVVFKPLKLDLCFNWTTCSDDKIRHAVVLYDEKGGVKKDELTGIRPPCPVAAGPDGACDLGIYRPGSNGGLFGPQGGLRISARDLARVGQLLLLGGRGFITPASFATLTTPAWRYDGANGDSENGFFCAYGLAVQTLGNAGHSCNDAPFGDGQARIGHAGEAYGLKSGLWVDRATGKGVAYFTTAVPDDAPRGRSAFYKVEEDILGLK
jgi:CubicO group peptidase (beta-lactamase class C family)